MSETTGNRRISMLATNKPFPYRDTVWSCLLDESRVRQEPHIDATSIALAGLRFHYHLPEVRQSLSWLLAADCSSGYSLAWKILALQCYVDVRSDARPAMEAAQAKLAVLAQEPAQIAENPTLALVILAFSGNPNPVALEVAA
jgi:hypothetical protein